MCSRLTNSKLKRVIHLAQEMAVLSLAEVGIKKKKKGRDIFYLLFLAMWCLDEEKTHTTGMLWFSGLVIGQNRATISNNFIKICFTYFTMPSWRIIYKVLHLPFLSACIFVFMYKFTHSTKQLFCNKHFYSLLYQQSEAKHGEIAVIIIWDVLTSFCWGLGVLTLKALSRKGKILL